MPGRCLVVGSVNTDIVLVVPRFAEPGETLLATGMSVIGGGKGANQAVAAARLGAHVTLIAAIGNDLFSEHRYNELEREGIDLRFLARVAELGGLALIERNAEGENRIVVAAGANAALDGESVRRAMRELELCSQDVVVTQLEIPPPGGRSGALYGSGNWGTSRAQCDPMERCCFGAPALVRCPCRERTRGAPSCWRRQRGADRTSGYSTRRTCAYRSCDIGW